jgi:hypothetical protein
VWSLNDRQGTHVRVFAFDCPTTTSSCYPLLSSPCFRRFAPMYHCTWTETKSSDSIRGELSTFCSDNATNIALLHVVDTWLRLTGSRVVQVEIPSRGTIQVPGCVRQSQHAGATALPSCFSLKPASLNNDMAQYLRV